MEEKKNQIKGIMKGKRGKSPSLPALCCGSQHVHGTKAHKKPDFIGSPDPRTSWVLSGVVTSLITFQAAKFLQNSSNSEANYGYRNTSVSAIADSSILVFPSSAKKQS